MTFPRTDLYLHAITLSFDFSQTSSTWRWILSSYVVIQLGTLCFQNPEGDNMLITGRENKAFILGINIFISKEHLFIRISFLAALDKIGVQESY